MDKIINNNMNEEIRYCKCGCGEVVNRCNHTINKKGIKKGDFNSYIQNHHIKVNNPMKGKHHTQEVKDIISKARKGHKMSEAHKEIMRIKATLNPPTKNPLIAKKISEKLKGRIFSEEHRKKISKSRIGKPSWNKGKNVYTGGGIKKGHIFGPMSEEHKEKIRKAEKGKIIPLEVRNKIKLANLGKFIGEKNPAWLGGKSFEPYTSQFNNIFKLNIKQRDGFICLKCGMREEDSIKLFSKRLSIHHIDYDKKLSIKENCCTLCVRCNAEVNTNRNSWTKFFQSLLSERYDYNYSEEGLPIIKINIGEKE